MTHSSHLSLPLALAVLLPLTGYAFHRLVAIPPVADARLRISPGLASVPEGPAKTRINEIYPENLFGEEGGYASLPYGRTRYALLGPKDGRKVVLIHGLSMPSVIFKGVAKILALEGFRVLTYDLYGRGYSDAPHINDTPGLYTSQLALLLQHISWQKTRVVGLSMGGAIAAAFADQFPQLVDEHIVFLASVGTYPDNHFGLAQSFWSSSSVQYFTTSAYVRSLKKVPPPPKTETDALDQLVMLQGAALPRFNLAISTSKRHGVLRGMQSSFRAVGERDDLRVLLVHGTADEDVPYHPFLSPNLTDLLPTAKLVSLPDVGHELTATHPEDVAHAIVEFFNESNVGKHVSE